MNLGDLSSQPELCPLYEVSHVRLSILPGGNDELFQFFNCGTVKPAYHLLFGRIAGEKLFNAFTHSVT